jgi:enamine deaminase RidA (YjgF/YER057c/UK114 family)
MPKHRYLNPDKIAKPVGYTHVVEAAAPGRIIFISGQLGLDLDNRIVGAPGDFRAQAEQTFVNLANALAAVGAASSTSSSSTITSSISAISACSARCATASSTPPPRPRARRWRSPRWRGRAR